MAENDQLDGFRGIRPEQVRRAYTDAAEREDEIRVQQLASTYVLGVQTEKVLLKIAGIEDAREVCAAIVDGCEAQVRQAQAELLAISNLNSPEAKDAHFRGRVAAGMLTMLNEFVSKGHAAAAAIHEEQDQ